MASRSREGMLPLYFAFLRPAPRVLRPALEPSAQDRAAAVGVGPEEAPAVIRGLEPLCWEERLGELGLLSLGKRRLRGDLRAGFQQMKRAYKKDAERLFTMACSDRTRGNSFKLKECTFRLDIRKNFFFFFNDDGGETVEQVAQRSCGYPITGSIQVQVGQGFEQPGLDERRPCPWQAGWTIGSLKSLPTKTIL